LHLCFGGELARDLGDCMGNKGVFQLETQLDWCSTDDGFNEGAVCGANIAAQAGVGASVPQVALPVLGNTWDRTNMMGPTKTVYRDLD
jgi:hypothetical protein